LPFPPPPPVRLPLYVFSSPPASPSFPPFSITHLVREVGLKAVLEVAQHVDRLHELLEDLLIVRAQHQLSGWDDGFPTEEAEAVWPRRCS